MKPKILLVLILGLLFSNFTYLPRTNFFSFQVNAEKIAQCRAAIRALPADAEVGALLEAASLEGELVLIENHTEGDFLVLPKTSSLHFFRELIETTTPRLADGEKIMRVEYYLPTGYNLEFTIEAPKLFVRDKTGYSQKLLELDFNGFMAELKISSAYIMRLHEELLPELVAHPKFTELKKIFVP
jgi:hypothetical protein